MNTYWIELVIGIFLIWWYRDEINQVGQLLLVKVLIWTTKQKIKYYTWRIQEEDKKTEEVEQALNGAFPFFVFFTCLIIARPKFVYIWR